MFQEFKNEIDFKMKNQNSIQLSRREMLKSVSSGFGYLALAGLCTEAAEKNALAPKAKRRAPERAYWGQGEKEEGYM